MDQDLNTGPNEHALFLDSGFGSAAPVPDPQPLVPDPQSLVPDQSQIIFVFSNKLRRNFQNDQIWNLERPGSRKEKG